jgi:predicted O-methyltransferase YrrM
MPPENSDMGAACSFDLRAVAEWRSARPPERAISAGGLLWPEERQLLYHLASAVYKGQCAIIDAGAFAGASAVCLAEGLKHNANIEPEGFPKIHSFDRFVVDTSATQELWRKRCGVSKQINDSFEDVFLQQTAPYSDIIALHKGDFRAFKWPAEPIGILFLDICKNAKLNSNAIDQFFPCLTPGGSILVHQDYFNAHVPWIHITMEYLSESFDCLVEKCGESRVFGLRKPIPLHKLERCVSYNFTVDEQIQLMDLVVAKTSNELKPHLLLVRAVLLYYIYGSHRLRQELSAIPPEVRSGMNQLYLNQVEALYLRKPAKGKR